MTRVPGTQGYEQVVDAFIEASKTLDFDEVNKPFLEFLPCAPSRILDVGAGAGQNAAALANRGHSVVAVEPLAAFLNAARSAYGASNVTWVEDGLPSLGKLGDCAGQFDFILVQGVWHHLDEEERRLAMARLSSLLGEGGVCAMSLRHGPAGAGTRVFPTDGRSTASLAREHGLEVVLHHANQPSLMKNKRAVTWTHMAFRKRGPRLPAA